MILRRCSALKLSAALVALAFVLGACGTPEENKAHTTDSCLADPECRPSTDGPDFP